MASMRDIKRRKSSITSTQQITKAMKLVSTVKLQKARAHAEATDPYFNYMYRTVSSMLAKSGNLEHPYLKAGDSPRKAVVVLTSNRGLAGGYNSNIVKLITHGDFKKEELDIYAVGAKGEELLTSKGYHIVESAPEMMEDPTYEDAAALCKRVLKAFTDGQVGGNLSRIYPFQKHSHTGGEAHKAYCRWSWMRVGPMRKRTPIFS